MGKKKPTDEEIWTECKQRAFVKDFEIVKKMDHFQLFRKVGNRKVYIGFRSKLNELLLLIKRC